MTQQKTRHKRERTCFIFFSWKWDEDDGIDDLQRKKHEFEVDVFTNIQICELFQNKRPVSLMFAHTYSKIMPNRYSSGQVP